MKKHFNAVTLANIYYRKSKVEKITHFNEKHIEQTLKNTDVIF